MIADMVTNKIGLADAFFFIALLIALAAAVVSMAKRPETNRWHHFLGWLALACVSFAWWVL